MYPNKLKQNLSDLVSQYKNKKIIKLDIKYKGHTITQAIKMNDGLIIIIVNDRNRNVLYEYVVGLEKIVQYLIYKKLIRHNIYAYVSNEYKNHSQEEIEDISDKIYLNTTRRKVFKKTRK